MTNLTHTACSSSAGHKALRVVLDHPIRHVAQNIAMGVPPIRRIAQRYHHTGAMNDVTVIVERTENTLCSAESHGVEIRGSRLLELGPGKTIGLAAAMAACGADHVYTADTEPYISRVDGRSLAPIMEGLTVANLTHSEDRTTRAPNNDVALRIQCEIIGPTGLIPLADGSIDIVYSFSVLEHVRSLSQTLGEVNRVLRRGGLTIHSIDLRDHYRLSPGEDWLHFLRYGPRMWEAMTSRRSSWCNRLRAPEHFDLFSRYFEVLEFDEHKSPLPTPYHKSASQFERFTRAELEVSELWVVCRKR